MNKSFTESVVWWWFMGLALAYCAVLVVYIIGGFTI
jgi:hypothetical protein